jgi:hypothetical protein
MLTHPLEEPHPIVADSQLQQQPEQRAGGAALDAALAAAAGGAASPAAAMSSGLGFGGEGVTLSGWANESVIWAGESLPYVATFNDVRRPAAALPVTPAQRLRHRFARAWPGLGADQSITPAPRPHRFAQAHGRLAIWRLDPAPPGLAPPIGSQHELPVVSPSGLQPPRTPATGGLMPAFAGAVRTPMSVGSFAGASYAPSTIKRCVRAAWEGEGGARGAGRCAQRQ